MVPITAVLTFALLAAPGAVGDVTYAEYYVSKANGSDATGTGSIESPWASIGYAVDQISAGPINPATLHVSLGQYIEVVTLPAFVDLVGETASPTCIPYDDDDCTMMRGLRVSADNVVSRVVFKAYQAPGIICSGTGAPYFAGCHFYEGLWVKTGEGGPTQVIESASPVFSDCRFSYNITLFFQSPGGRGGGLWHNSAGQTILLGCTFDENQAEFGGASTRSGDRSCAGTACLRTTVRVGVRRSTRPGARR